MLQHLRIISSFSQTRNEEECQRAESLVGRNTAPLALALALALSLRVQLFNKSL